MATVEQFIQCEEQLDSIFPGLSPTSILQKIINQVKQFYRHTYQYDSSSNQTIELYQRLVKGLQRLKDADVNERLRIAVDLKQELLIVADEREARLGRDKIKILCEMSYLLIAAVFIYLGLFTLLAPSFAVHPVLGLLLLAVFTRFYIAELIDHIRDIDFITPEYTSRILQEEKNERTLVDFFLPEQANNNHLDADGLASQEEGEEVSLKLS